jgi:FkbM family methyltransferase
VSVLPILRHGAAYSMNDPGGRVGSVLATGRPYEWPLLDEIAGRQFSGTAFDVGAHVGNHTVFLAAVCGLNVVAWEPDDRAYEMLLDNLALNPGLRVETFKVAAGETEARGALNSLMTGSECDDGDVTICPVDDVVDCPDLSVVKIDVEGYEHRVLAGMTRHLLRSHPVVYAEAHGTIAQRQQHAVLAPLGYRVTGEIKMGSPMFRWEFV